MERLVANLSGAPRRERLNDREYLVASATLMTPGVLNGSKGPGLYELQDIQDSVDAWNGMPIVVNHPVDAQGNSLSGRTPKALEQFGIGWVFNTVVNGKLSSELWFDVEKTRKVDARIVNKLERGERIELSTGLAVSRETKQGVHNESGKQYEWIARKHRPDHLAILPDGRGACAVSDGCGVNNEEPKGLLQKIAELVSGRQITKEIVENKEPTMADKKLTDVERKAIVDDLITNCSCTWKEEDRATLNEMNEAMLAKCKGMMGKVSNNADLEKKLKEQELLTNAARKGLKVGNDQYTLNDKGEWVRKEPEVVENQDKGSHRSIKLEDLPTELQEDIAFARNAKQRRREELIDRLVANHDKDKQSTSRDVFNELPLEKLETLAAGLPVNNQQQTTQGQISYFGAQVGNRSVAKEGPKHEPLGLPVYNFDREKQSA